MLQQLLYKCFVHLFQDYWSLLCRGRKKKIVTLVIILVLLINAMFYVSLELYNTVKRKNKEPWYNR